MALILLTLIGGLLGWLASIVIRVEDRDGILRLMGIAVAASLVAGLFTNNGSVLGNLRAEALGAAVAAALAALAAMIYLRQRRGQD